MVRLDGDSINPVTSEYIINAIRQAEREGAECLVIELDTPGGLLSSTRTIIKHILASEVPVVVYVAPSGARAGSAGVFITYASHVAAMAPSTNIGAAHPVQMGEGNRRTVWDALRDLIDSLARRRVTEKEKQPREERQTSPIEDKVLKDTLAFVKAIAQERNRNVEWAEKSVLESASITEKEALEMNVVEIVARNERDLLEQLDGYTVTVAKKKKTLATEDATIRHLPMNFRQRFLNVLANPNIAYFLLILGFYGLLFEVTHPGIGVPGILGVIFLILGLFSLQMLPTNYAGLFLMILGIVLFAAEMFIPGFGLPTLGGLACMILGSLLLFESPFELMRVSFTLVLALSLATAVITILLVSAVIRTHKRKVKTGDEGLIGEEGETATALEPGKTGRVFIHGEIWNAVASEAIGAKQRVKVVQREGMTLKVKKSKGGG